MASRAEFRQNIVDAFSVEDLVTLCADLGVDADLIPGRDKGKAHWVDQLITYFDRRNKTPELVAKLRAERPDQPGQPKVDWSYVEVSPAIAPAVPALPVKWLIAAASVAVLVLLVVLVLPNLGPGAAPAQSTATAPALPTDIVATATAQATVIPATPSVVVERMPKAGMSILFVDFGRRDGTAVISSTEGAELSRDTADGFKRYLEEALPAEARQDFQATVWHSGDAAQHGWPIGPVATLTEAQQVAERVGARMVVYGNFAGQSPDAQLVIGFYVARLENAADEIVGPYQLSAPIPVGWPMTPEMAESTRLTLNARNRLLSWFAVGLAYDVLGRRERALQVFQQALASLSADDPIGRDVLYFFIAREHLLLGQTQQAEQNHQAALVVNPKYVRAHLGLGDVYLQYAAAITDAQTLLQSDALGNAVEQYGLAEEQASLAPDVPQLVTLARLGLGLVKQIQAGAHARLDQQAEAKTLATESLRLLEPALQALSQRPDGQRRTLALGYNGLGGANWTSARLIGDSGAAPNPLQVAFYEKADEAYAACMALDVGTDPFLTSNIVAACKRNQRRMNAERPE